MKTVWLFAFLILLAVPCHAVDCTGADKELKLVIQPISRTLQLGDSFGFDLTFTNTGQEPFFLDFSGATYGPTELNILSVNGECQYEVQPAHCDRRIEDFRFDYKPLLPRESFLSHAVTGSYADGTPDLNIRTPGHYQLWITYASQGDILQGTVWPIWYGCTKSNIVEVYVKLPPVTEMNKRVEELKACASQAANHLTRLRIFP